MELPAQLEPFDPELILEIFSRGNLNHVSLSQFPDKQAAWDALIAGGYLHEKWEQKRIRVGHIESQRVIKWVGSKIDPVIALLRDRVALRATEAVDPSSIRSDQPTASAPSALGEGQ